MGGTPASASANGWKIDAGLRADTSSPEELDEVLHLLLFRSLPTFAVRELSKRNRLRAASAGTLADLCRLRYEMEFGTAGTAQLAELSDALARRGHPQVEPSDVVLRIRHVRWTIFERNLVDALDDAAGFGVQDSYEVALAVLETLIRAGRYSQAAPLFRTWAGEIYHSPYYYHLLSRGLATLGQQEEAAGSLVRAIRIEPALRARWSGEPPAAASPPSLLDYALDFLGGHRQ